MRSTMKRAVRLVSFLVLSACGGGNPGVALNPPAPAPPPVSEPVAAPVASVVPAPVPSSRPLTLEERAARLHGAAIVIDTHDDITSAILEDGFDLGHPNGKTATDGSTVTYTHDGNGEITRDQTSEVTGPNGKVHTGSNTETYTQNYTPPSPQP